MEKRKIEEKPCSIRSLEVNRKDMEAKASLGCDAEEEKKISRTAKRDKIQNRKEEKSVIDPFYLSSTHNVIRIHSEFARIVPTLHTPPYRAL